MLELQLLTQIYSSAWNIFKSVNGWITILDTKVTTIFSYQTNTDLGENTENQLFCRDKEIYVKHLFFKVNAKLHYLQS